MFDLVLLIDCGMARTLSILYTHQSITNTCHQMRGSAYGIISDDSGVYIVAIISITAQGRFHTWILHEYSAIQISALERYDAKYGG